MCFKQTNKQNDKYEVWSQWKQWKQDNGVAIIDAIQFVH